MLEKHIFERWSNPEFIRGVEPNLSSVFVQKTTTQPVDLRGIVVGLDGALPELLRSDFQGAIIEGLDVSYAKFSCSFGRAEIAHSKFCKALFDTCRFKQSIFRETLFDQARMDSPTLDDANFQQCSFVGARITGRGANEYGGRRATFDHCNFNGVIFRNIQLRACGFRECSFEDAIFQKCLLVGVKFEGTRPSEKSFVECK